MDRPEPNELEALMQAHGPFLARLANALTADAAAAEDLVGDTWVAALRPGLGRLHSERGWLATVMRRRAAHLREKHRTEALDPQVRHPARDRAPDEILAQIEREQMLNGALAQLGEPYRSVLFLRYHDGLKPAAIAKRTATPLKTVKTRLSRGLEHLRRSLDQAMESRGAADPRAEWLGALLPLTLPPGAPPSASLGAAAGMMKFVLGALAALLITFAGVVAVRGSGKLPQTVELKANGDGSPSGAASPLVKTAQAEATRETPIPAGPTPTLDVPAGIDRAPLPLASSTGSQPAEAAANIATGITGTVVVLDDPSSDPSTLNGELLVTLRSESTRTTLTVEVKEGAFEVDFERLEDGNLVLVEGEHWHMDGAPPQTVGFSHPAFPKLGPAFLVEETGSPGAEGEVRVPIGAMPIDTTPIDAMPIGTVPMGTVPMGTVEVELVLQVAQATRLTVVDGTTGEEVSGVQVLGVRPQTGLSTHPMGRDTRSLTEESRSPFTLSIPVDFMSLREVEMFIGAPGYAWARINLDVSRGADRRIELAPGGTLTATVQGHGPQHAHLRLYQQGEKYGSVSQLPLKAAESVTWKGLPVGEYSVRVELGSLIQGFTTLAEAAVSVTPEDEQSVELELPAAKAVPSAGVSGVIVVPEAWALESLGASVSLIGVSSDGSSQRVWLSNDDFTPVQGSSDTFAFTIPPMEVGRYLFELAPMAWQTIYELPPEGVTDMRLELPAPVTITVHVVDAGDQSPIAADSISWSPARPAGSPGRNGGAEVEGPSAPGVFQFGVTPGPISLTCMQDGFIWRTHDVDAQPSASFTLRLERESKGTIQLMAGETRVPWPKGSFREVTAMDEGGGHLHVDGMDDQGYWFGVSKPGRYRLAIPDINGYWPHDPVEFEMVAGETTKILVELTPK